MPSSQVPETLIETRLVFAKIISSMRLDSSSTKEGVGHEVLRITQAQIRKRSEDLKLGSASSEAVV